MQNIYSIERILFKYFRDELRKTNFCFHISEIMSLIINAIFSFWNLIANRIVDCSKSIRMVIPQERKIEYWFVCKKGYGNKDGCVRQIIIRFIMNMS